MKAGLALQADGRRTPPMAQDRTRIGVAAPSSRLPPDSAEKVRALAARLYPDGRVEIVFHPQCFESEGHFAGPDAARAAAFLEVANDPGFDALWFGRGGYGSCRIAEAVLDRLEPAALRKAYLGYSDAGAMLAGLYKAGATGAAHGPVVNDISRAGGDQAAARALAWLVERSPEALEPSVDGSAPTAAFNLAILTSLIGTPLQPDLPGHVLMLEEVSEYMYRIDRMMFQLTSSAVLRQVAGVRLGRCSDIPDNDPPFGMDAEAVVRGWCERAGVAYLGGADIGHDVGNKVVPFGRLTR
jgi:muramoyltetrapeptide carboxypeptidase